MSEGTRVDSNLQYFAQTPECDEARERTGLTVRIPAPRSQNQPVDQTGEVETREREP